MSSLFAALSNVASSMDALEQAMGVVQNNVANASTPGYASQSINLEALPFNPSNNLSGGLTTAGLSDSRNQFAEQAVWSQNELLGSATQSASSLSALQSVFNVTGTSGIPGALSALYSAFSAWSSNPADGPSKQQVLEAAQGVAQAFNSASNSVGQISAQTNQQLQSTVTEINNLSSQIAQLNAQIRQGDRNDPGLQAQLYNDLEQLSNLTSISVQVEGDGTVTVSMAGQTPLVVGGTVTTLSVNFVPSPGASSAAPPDAQILTSAGQDVTGIASGASGQIGALLQFRNVVIPKILGDGQQAGELNELAQSIADQINSLIESAQSGAGISAVPLFTYAGMVNPPGSPSTSPTSVAATLALNPSITASQLVAAGPDSSGSSSSTANGIADQLAQLASTSNVMAGGTSTGMTFTDFYSSLASDIGNQEANASAAQQTQSQLLSQAQSARSQLEGVSLNQQAALLMQFQQGYEAASEMISVINNTTQYLMQVMEQL